MVIDYICRMSTLLGAIKGSKDSFAFEPNLTGKKTKFYTDVKVPVKAGMEFGTRNYKIRTIGYDLFRLYFDSAEKDYQVGVTKVKRVFNKR